MAEKCRCAWVTDDQIYKDYHDNEWGRPVHDDQKLFEAIVLDAFQAGLSWLTILKKRENFREAFHGFDVQKVASYNTRQVDLLMQNAGIVRNRLKIQAATTNARLIIRMQEHHGSFDKYIWQFVNGKPIINHRKTIAEIPATSPESDAMSRDLKKRGFKFIGSTICYAFMQATGMVNDHTVDCFRYKA
ncbi:MAG: DNA-3-methyladenine glycosylase I [Deltaproteobacteria bacterium CG11_big_fil_rev_8_21_14_0_20_47_16]|nr:MAG: DNA-3-methyladenine glycosylase I [Deltaproteobacteria bacterium CG11_big_fil_rev_8_21_14_0_20_47_16]